MTAFCFLFLVETTSHIFCGRRHQLSSSFFLHVAVRYIVLKNKNESKRKAHFKRVFEVILKTFFLVCYYLKAVHLCVEIQI